MKAFNVSHYDDRRLCFKRTCDETVIAFQWDHAVRDFLDPEWRLSTICCEEEGVCQEEEKEGCRWAGLHAQAAHQCHMRAAGAQRGWRAAAVQGHQSQAQI